MASIIGTSGTKTFWRGTTDYHFAGVAGCRACGSELAAKLCLRTIYETTPNAMVFGRSCGAGRSELQTGGRIGCDGSGLTGIWAGMKARGIADRNLVCLTGEGRTLEMGFGDFIAAFDREIPVTWIILDNQSYAASGSTATATTPLHAMTRIFSRETGGKNTAERKMAMMMIFAKARYVATATPAYVKDLVVKVQEALQHKPSYVHVVSPCQIGWMYRPELGVKVSRLMVQTGVLPLWSFKDGVFKRTVRIPPAKVPVKNLLDLQRRFENVTEADIADIEARIERENTLVDAMERTLNQPKVTVSY